ncbi:acyl-CoA dehydrogenase domain-containing protein, partial [Cobetia marina]
GVTLGPRNYIGVAYAGTPVSITVEGANIMTRNLMIFGQGAIRCHPYVLEELAAKDADDLNAFDKAFFRHAGLIFGNAARAFSQSFGIGGKTTGFDAVATPYANHINRFSAAFSLSADAAMASLGSSLKAREMLSARLGDVLSNLYLASLTLKQWHESDACEHEEALFHYSMQWLLHRTEKALDELLANLPNRALATTLRVVMLPRGRQFAMPRDSLTREIARAVSTDSALRTKLTDNTWDAQDEGQKDNALARYNALLKDYPRAEPI